MDSFDLKKFQDIMFKVDYVYVKQAEPTKKGLNLIQYVTDN